MPELAGTCVTCQNLPELAEPARTCQNLSELAKLAGTCGTCRNLPELCRHSRNVWVVITFSSRSPGHLFWFHTDLPCRPQPPAPPTARPFPCRNLQELAGTFIEPASSKKVTCQNLQNLQNLQELLGRGHFFTFPWPPIVTFASTLI